jgi:hypothetical protein
LEEQNMGLGRFLLCAAMASCSGAAFGADVYEVPTAWRLQNYVGGGVIVYYVTAPGCTSGGIVMPASATPDEKNRFWSTILTAKATGKAIGIYYSVTGSNCTVDSFYIQN